jgi:Protein of unknown function (DUF4242)
MARTYLVECFWPGVSEELLADTTARATTAESAVDEVSCLETILVPHDEIVFCVFAGPSAERVGDVARHAGLPVERVCESVRTTREENDR